MAVCKNCKCEPKYCGCADKAVPVAPPCGQGTDDCPVPEPCAETFSAECIIYTGDTMPEYGISKGDRLDDIIQRIVLYQVNPGCIKPWESGSLPPNPGNDCIAVTGLHTDYISASQIKLLWTASPTAVGYVIEYIKITDMPGPWTYIGTTTLPITTTYYTVGNLQSCTTYYFRIKSVCLGGGLCNSVVIQVKTKNTTPSVPCP